jgi:hypothetical protein
VSVLYGFIGGVLGAIATLSTVALVGLRKLRSKLPTRPRAVVDLYIEPSPSVDDLIAAGLVSEDK